MDKRKTYEEMRSELLEPLRIKARKMYKDAEEPEAIAEMVFNAIEEMVDDRHAFFYRG